MKKIIIGGAAIVILLGSGVAAYFFYFKEEQSGSSDFVSKWDLIDVIEPVEFSMRGQTFKIPAGEEVVEATEASDSEEVTELPRDEEVAVELNLVAPGNVRDYPMGRIDRADGTRVTLTALDDFLSDEIAGKRAVLLRKHTPEAGDEFYFGIIRITGDRVEHLSSLPIGDHIRPRSLATDGDTIVFNYDVHDRGQELAETPRINTSATFDLATETVLIAGRDPKTEAVVRYKTFSGQYLWQYTETADARIEPIEPDKFTLRFNANRIELGTDCNSGDSTFSTEPLPATSFAVQNISATTMFCESEQEDIYFGMVGNIVSYEESEDGTLTFLLNDDSEMVFIPREQALEFSS